MFLLGVPKVLSEGVNKIFLKKKIHMGIRNQKLGKVKNFQVWMPEDFLSKGQKSTGLEGLTNIQPDTIKTK